MAPFSAKPRCFADSRATIITPRPVASRRPSDPPISTGLPVTTAVERVADVHRVGVGEPRHDLFVGVDVGRRHVLVGADGVDDLRGVAAGQRFELAAATSWSGSQMTPPLPPPKGSCATAHFHVIQAASAVTSSSETSGW